jgi:hypothetical protein
MKFLLLTIGVLTAFLSSAQYGKDFNLMNNRIIVNHPESTVYAFVVPENDKRKTSDAYFYYWFASNDIKKTRGAYEGKLLHGFYTEFYLNKNLKEKGRMKYGLKKGRWTSWYPNGEYKEIVHYKKSKRLDHKTFYNTGAIQSRGKYRKDKLHGIVRNYSPEGILEKIRYKNGNVVVRKKKLKEKKEEKGNWDRNRKIRKDSIASSDSATLRKPFWKRSLKKKAVPEADTIHRVEQAPQLMPEMVQPTPVEEKSLKKEKNRKKDKNKNIKIRKFLWIIPLEPTPSKEKQT